jgi:hypothetical protein
VTARLKRAAQLIADGASEYDALVGAGYSEITARNWPGVTASLVHWGFLEPSVLETEASSTPVEEPVTPAADGDSEPDGTPTDTKRRRGRPRKGE